MINNTAKKTERTGWVSPDYTTSSHITLDPNHLEESRCVGFLPDGRELAAYKMLRTQLLQGLRGQNRNVIMVTSTRAGEGKTLTAINLSLTLAREYSQTVLLVDADLRHQMVHRYLGYESGSGLIDHLTRGVEISDLTVWPGVEKLTVISGGEGSPHESSELLGSPVMRNLVQELKDRYAERLIIFDLPAMLDGDDALTFAPFVDSIVFVVEAHRTQLPEITNSINMLPQDKLAGVVLNKYS